MTVNPETADTKPVSLIGTVKRVLRSVYAVPGVRRTLRVLGISLGRLYQDDGWAMASHLTLSALMALFPFLIVVGAVASFFGDPALADQVVQLLFQSLPEQAGGDLEREVRNVLAGPNTGVLTISILATIYLASNGVEAVRAALTRAYGTEQHRSFFVLKLQSFGFVIIGAVAALVLAFLGAFGPLIWTVLQRFQPDLADFTGSFTLFRYIIVGSLLTAALVAAHLWLPGKRFAGLRIWPGIIATLVLWWVATVVFAAYLEGFANYISTYAGLAGIVTALFYIYVMSLILIFGAELNAAIARTRPRAARRRDRERERRRALAAGLDKPPANDD